LAGFFNFTSMRKLSLSALFLFLALVVASAQYSFDPKKLSQELKELSSSVMDGRKTGTEGNRKARIYIIDHLKQLGIERFVPGYEQPFSISQAGSLGQGTGGVNILGVIPGKKKGTIVISAHYDHLGNRDGKVYYGADDNASGVAALLAMGEYFKKNAPEHRIILAFFDAEEMGLRGSAYFVNSLDLEKENVVLNINMDMIARGDKNELYACGTYHYPQLKAPVERIKKPEGITLLFGHDNPETRRDDWTSQSDQGSFHAKKIPFLYFGVEDHPDYHRATDTFDKVNLDFYAKSAETVLQAVKALDKSLD
jgi:Zn-dependent M28 family amino/carboxypeptidase